MVKPKKFHLNGQRSSQEDAKGWDFGFLGFFFPFPQGCLGSSILSLLCSGGLGSASLRAAGLWGQWGHLWVGFIQGMQCGIPQQLHVLALGSLSLVRIVESWNSSGWKGSTRITEPNSLS